jgi:hypothetical protein
MTTTPKTFSASTTESREAPTEQFDLEGVYAQGRSGPDKSETWKESFTVSSRMDARAAGWYASAFMVHEGKQVINPPAVIEFLVIACVPESALRFRDLIDDPDRLVDVQVLGAVFVWLTEEVIIARPTAPPSA